jgi:hypothetical protein
MKLTKEKVHAIALQALEPGDRPPESLQRSAELRETLYALCSDWKELQRELSQSLAREARYRRTLEDVQKNAILGTVLGHLVDTTLETGPEDRLELERELAMAAHLVLTWITLTGPSDRRKVPAVQRLHAVLAKAREEGLLPGGDDANA